MILRILIASILVGIIATVNAEARNEYLNDGTNSCDQGSWEAYSEVRQQEYKTGTNDESQQLDLDFQHLFLFYIHAVLPLYTLPNYLDHMNLCHRLGIHYVPLLL